MARKSTAAEEDYRSYLLRLWREEQAPGAWRASLESVITGERRGFASLDALFDFLRDQIADTAGNQKQRSTEL